MTGPDLHDGEAYTVDVRGRSRARLPWRRPPNEYPRSAPPGPAQTSRHRIRRVLVGVGLLAVAWLAFMVWVPFHAWGNVHRIDASPSGARPTASKGYDYVLVGSDSRDGLSTEQQKQLSTGSAKDGLGKRTDATILVHVPPVY